MLDYDKKKLGTYLKEVRENSHWTQLQVSQKLGYSSPQFISNIERGISVVPLKTLARMIQIYKVDGEEVVGILLESQKKILKSRLIKGR